LPSKDKETNYFSDKIGSLNNKANYIQHHLSKYESVFPEYDGERIVFESTPGYINSPIALEGLLKLDPPPIILFIYRDPVERIYSEFTFHKYKTKFFKGSFSDYVGWNGHDFSGDYFEKGKIVDHINNWNKKFGENVNVFMFKELKKNPKHFMKKLCGVINIDHSFYNDFEFSTKNATFGLRNRHLHLIALNAQKRIPSSIKKLLIPVYYRFNKTKIPNKTAVDSQLLEALNRAYHDQSLDNIKAKIV